ERSFRNSAAVGNRHQAAAAAAPQAMPDAVAVQIGRVAAAASRDPFGEDFQKRVKVRARQLAIRIRPAYNLKQIVFIPLFARAHGHDLLSQDIQRGFRDVESVELTLPDSFDQRGALDQLVARGGKEATLGYRASPM